MALSELQIRNAKPKSKEGIVRTKPQFPQILYVVSENLKGFGADREKVAGIGGPWFEHKKDCDFADLWESERARTLFGTMLPC